MCMSRPSLDLWKTCFSSCSNMFGYVRIWFKACLDDDYCMKCVENYMHAYMSFSAMTSFAIKMSFHSCIDEWCFRKCCMMIHLEKCSCMFISITLIKWFMLWHAKCVIFNLIKVYFCMKCMQMLQVFSGGIWC